VEQAQPEPVLTIPHPPIEPPHSSVLSEGTGDLARLLNTEARLDDVLRQARDEAAGLVASARDRAAAREAALAAALDALVGELETVIEAERRHQHEEIVESARQQARAFDEAGAAQIDALAHYVVDRVIGVEP